MIDDLQYAKYIVCYPNFKKTKEAGQLLVSNFNFKGSFSSHKEAKEYAQNIYKEIKSQYNIANLETKQSYESKGFFSSAPETSCPQYKNSRLVEKGDLIDQNGNKIQVWSSILIYEDQYITCREHHGNGLYSETDNCSPSSDLSIHRYIVGVIDWESNTEL